MKIYLCKWPDGTGKVVVCRNREELFWALDFESDPYSAKYKVLKGDLAFNFRIEKGAPAHGDNGWTRLTDYDHESDFIAEEFASDEGWRTLRNFFPYGDTDVSSQQAKATCAAMGWNPAGSENKEVK